MGSDCQEPTRKDSIDDLPFVSKEIRKSKKLPKDYQEKNRYEKEEEDEEKELEFEESGNDQTKLQKELEDQFLVDKKIDLADSPDFFHTDGSPIKDKEKEKRDEEDNEGEDDDEV